jgi:hypothetical protein
VKRICIAWLSLAVGAPAWAQQQPYCPPNNLNPNCPNNVIELKRQQDEARRQAQIRAQQEALQRAQQEAAQRAAIQRAQQEAAQKAAMQKAQQEAAQRAAIQKAQQDAAQRAAIQKAQQEAAQRAAIQKAQQEAGQRAQQEAAQRAARTQQEAAQRAQQEAAQKAALQRAQQESAQKAAIQRAQQEAAQKAAIQKAQQDAAQRAAIQKAQQEAAQRAAIQRQQQEAAQKAAYERKLREDAQRIMGKPAPAPQPVPSVPKVASPQPAPVPSAPPTAPRQLALSPMATVAPAPNRSGYTINQTRPDGSKVIVQQTLLPSGTRQVTAYRQIEDPRARTSTRVYLDGYRVTQAPTYVSRTLPNQATYTQYNTGLRGFVLPGNRTVYKEQFITVRSNGAERQYVQRTVYMAPAAGGYAPLKTQVVQVYDVVRVYERPVYVYRPVRYAPVFFVPFAAPFAAPLIAGPQCTVCPPPVVAYDAPPRYSNSYELLGDMQLAGPLLDDPLLPARDAQGNLPARPEVASLRNEVDDLQRQLDEQARDSAELQAALAQGSLQRTSTADAAADVSRMKVPDRVRDVMRKQVRLSVAQHQNGNPLLLSDVVESGYARIYVFQAAAPIEVEDVRTGAPCRLAAGDLTEFHKVPDAGAAAAPMSVIASRPGHCEPNQVVHVKFEDLQEMLNAFSQRVEANMQKLNACLTARGGCQRT